MHAKPDNQTTFEDRIYSLIPDDHFLKSLQKTIDWKFIDKRCRRLYSTIGRPALPAETMFKLVLLQFIYKLSDRQLEESVRDRNSFRWFVGFMLSITDATHVKAKVNTWRWKDDDDNPGGKQGPDGDAKFGEMKKYHGLGQARYWGLAKMEFQAIMTAIAVNVKHMVTMLTGRPRWVMT